MSRSSIIINHQLKSLSDARINYWKCSIDYCTEKNIYIYIFLTTISINLCVACLIISLLKKKENLINQKHRKDSKLRRVYSQKTQKVCIKCTLTRTKVKNKNKEIFHNYNRWLIKWVNPMFPMIDYEIPNTTFSQCSLRLGYAFVTRDVLGTFWLTFQEKNIIPFLDIEG